MLPAAASADTVTKTYVACNQYNDCWRADERYVYPSDQKIIIHNGAWYAVHQSDEQVRWLNDPADDRGWYVQDGSWHGDPGLPAAKGGVAGAGVGAAIGCLATLPAGCAPGAAMGAAGGGATGVVAGAASTPHDYHPPNGAMDVDALGEEAPDMPRGLFSGVIATLCTT